MFHEKEKRLFIIGLDGVPYSLIREFIENGELINFREIFKEGDFVQMDSVYPTISSVAWTTFITGFNPGGHGIYGFVEPKNFSYDIFIPTYKDIKKKTIYDYLKDLKIVSINVPVTYPVFKIKGILISGFLAPDLKKGVYPEEILNFLLKNGYILDVDPWLAREGKKEKFLEKIYEATDKRFLIMEEFLNEKAELNILHIMETDRLFHFFFNDKKIILDYFKFVERKISNFLKKIKDYELLILSDHGFCEIEKEVNINAILKEKKILIFEKEFPDSLFDIKEDSLCFSMTPGRIYLNSKEKRPKAKFREKEIEGKMKEIFEIFNELEFDGKKVVKEIKGKREIFGENPEGNPPEYLLISFDGFDLKADIKDDRIFYNSELKGMHTYNDAFLFIKNYKIKKRPKLKDILPTILKIMDKNYEKIEGEVLI
ncbi:MAG: alkaline phosphatase family protein [candidate division WOR-3 bacterium]